MLLQLIAIQVITFVLLLVGLRLLFSKNLTAALWKLRRIHEENLVKEEGLKKELDETKKKKEEEFARAREEAAKIVKEAREKAEAVAQEAKEEAKREAKKITDQSKAELEKLSADLRATYHEDTVALAADLLKATFALSDLLAVQHQLIAELLAGIKDIDKTQFTVRDTQVKVLSACPLDAGEKTSLAAILAERTGVAVTLEERIDPELIAGLVVQIGALTIDGSFRNKLKKVLPYVIESRK